MKSQLYKSLFNKLHDNEQASELLLCLVKNANIYLFGGAVRNYLDGCFESFRDLDFVVEFKSGTGISIKDIIRGKNYSFEINRFNGYKFCFRNLLIDIWDINDTWAFKHTELKTTPDNLLKSVFLNMDGLVYSLNEKRFLADCDKVYQKMKASRYLDIVLPENPFVELNLLRAMILKRKYNMRFSNNLQESLLHYAANADLTSSFLKLQQEHYKNTIITRKEIECELSYLFNQ
jgi:hypothetical protein